MADTYSFCYTLLLLPYTLPRCSADAAYNAGCLLERGDPVAKMAKAAEIEVRTSLNYFSCNMHLLHHARFLSSKRTLTHQQMIAAWQ
jgi:hypothetical protein